MKENCWTNFNETAVISVEVILFKIWNKMLKMTIILPSPRLLNDDLGWKCYCNIFLEFLLTICSKVSSATPMKILLGIGNYFENSFGNYIGNRQFLLKFLCPSFFFRNSGKEFMNFQRNCLKNFQKNDRRN